MKIRKVLISLVTCFIVSCFIHVTIVRADDLVTDGKAAILIEAETGEILYEKNSHEKLAPASMTKMMSMYLILEAKRVKEQEGEKEKRKGEGTGYL